jgi:hypothetical protein
MDVRRATAGLASRIPRTLAAALASATATALVLLALSAIIADRPAHRPFFPLTEVPHPCDGVDELRHHHPAASANDTGAPETAAIPNVVHYVWLLRNPNELRLDFKTFVSVYSAHLFFAPERIYIHTDAREEVYLAAKNPAAAASSSPSSKWTARTLNIPGVEARFVRAPTATTFGVPVAAMEHRADFLRVDALHELGGVYLDTDAVPLRSMAALRAAGFANVVGGAVALSVRHAGFVNNGVMMARPGSMLMTVWRAASHRFYDGKWDTASIQLLTDLAQRMVAVPGEVLILHPRALAPTSWEKADQANLFLPRLPAMALPGGEEEDPSAVGLMRALAGGGDGSCVAALDWLTRREAERGDDGAAAGVLDLSSTYVLHAFDGDVRRLGGGWDGVVDLAYVLARRSNYARAVFPAVWHAVQAGVIPEAEARV